MGNQAEPALPSLDVTKTLEAKATAHRLWKEPLHLAELTRSEKNRQKEALDGHLALQATVQIASRPWRLRSHLNKLEGQSHLS